MGMLEIPDTYHMPRVCTECGGVMIFKGVGEYHCEDCGKVAYDDYGKVRLYLEKNPGANLMKLEQETGVSQKTIRQMLRESRIQVSENSQTFLHCEMCGTNIRFGRLCPTCEEKYHRNAEKEQRAKLHHHQDVHGFAAARKGEEGQRRFIRKDEG